MQDRSWFEGIVRVVGKGACHHEDQPFYSMFGSECQGARLSQLGEQFVYSVGTDDGKDMPTTASTIDDAKYYTLRCPVQHYEWGKGSEGLVARLAKDVSGKPCAEVLRVLDILIDVVVVVDGDSRQWSCSDC